MEYIDKKPTILLVDDMPSNISVLSNLLKDEYNLKIAKSGEKAISVANGENKPDLILLDVIMPDMDGYEVCINLKNNPETQNIPIIFVTSKDHIEDEEYGLNLGAVDYISKPYHPPIVKIRVKKHVELSIKTALLEQLSMYDGLTHIPNRRYFDDFYKKYYGETKRNDSILAVMMVDVDDFKKYNDNYGHGKGDECLIKIAKCLKDYLKRPSDIVARYGGEEFVLLIKETDPEGLKVIADKLLKSVSELNISHEYTDVADHVTISVGVSFKNAGDDISEENLLNKADKALYEAKNAGKNRYVLK